MKTIVRLLVAAGAFLMIGVRTAGQTRVIINLSEQRAYLIEQSKVTLISPIASGKPGWQTPTGNFIILNNSKPRIDRRCFRKSHQLECNSRQPRTPGRPFSTSADAVLHGI
jgi:hypothetical protein